MKKNYVITYLFATGLLALASGSISAHYKGQIELNFSMFNTDGMVEQDVFIENSADENKILRIPVAQVASRMNAELYSSSEEPPFDPSNSSQSELERIL